MTSDLVSWEIMERTNSLKIGLTDRLVSNLLSKKIIFGKSRYQKLLKSYAKADTKVFCSYPALLIFLLFAKYFVKDCRWGSTNPGQEEADKSIVLQAVVVYK